ncbi:hypothetical protein, variant [Cryptococcus amylolentus CBS 6039]|uniref:C2H2-type domain-containing protein n=1 Tax=Cryptococcus amylolentus CBS 6039 TaxID=1295533 RepID=A0A1E3HTJ5_9TREE|nr:hypothetical protein, variant [Cryptococcus amylolentus CBS 6039]ODN79670.1 hypothetical protein, variant [Cryptococcus amylolentus CBS 6039]
MPGKARKGKFSQNDDPKQTSLKGWITSTPSSAASQPSSSIPTEAPDRKAKRVATSSLEAHTLTAKKSRVGTSLQHPPAPDTVQRLPIPSTRNEPDPNDSDDSDDIPSDEDEDDCQDDHEDDGQSGQLDDHFARRMKPEDMPSNSLSVPGDAFWVEYLVRPLEQHASRLGIKATPMPKATYKRLSEVLDFVLGCKDLYMIWTNNPMSEEIRKLVQRSLGTFHANELPRASGKLRTPIHHPDPFPGRCERHELEGLDEVQRRCVGVYWKVAFWKVALGESQHTVEEDAMEENAEEDHAGNQYSIHPHPPLPVLIYTGQTSRVIPSGKSMGFRPLHEKFKNSRPQYRMAFAAIVTVPVPNGTELDTPLRNSLILFARLSEAVCQEAVDTVHRAAKSTRSRAHRTFWANGPGDYSGTNASPPLHEQFSYWDLGKRQRPCPECPVCGRLFATKSRLNTHHTDNHEPKTLGCKNDGCLYRCARESKLKKHVNRSHGEKTFSCERKGCESKFATNALLKQHVTSSHGEKTFSCERKGCESKFPTKGQLKQHVNKVHGEKKFVL